jgi:hypothetical protein
MGVYDGIWSSWMPCSKRTGTDDIKNFHKFAQIWSQKRFCNNLKIFSKHCKPAWYKLNRPQSRCLYGLSAAFFTFYCFYMRFTLKYWVEYCLSSSVESTCNEIKLPLFVKTYAKFQIIPILILKVIIKHFYIVLSLTPCMFIYSRILWRICFLKTIQNK